MKAAYNGKWRHHRRNSFGSVCWPCLCSTIQRREGGLLASNSRMAPRHGGYTGLIPHLGRNLCWAKAEKGKLKTMRRENLGSTTTASDRTGASWTGSWLCLLRAISEIRKILHGLCELRSPCMRRSRCFAHLVLQATPTTPRFQTL